ncbi:MAG: DMT family transporter [Acidobacteriota bacterium]
MHPERRVAAFLALTGSVIAISWSAIFVRWTEMPGTCSAFYRTLIASLVLWSLFPFLRDKSRRLTRRSFWITVAGGAFFSGDIGFWNTAVMHTSAGNATFLSNISPLFVGLFTWMLTRRLPSRWFWIAFVVGTVGTGLIVAADLRLAVSRSSADALAVIAAVCFALYLVITGRLREKHDVLELLALSTTASAVVLLVVAQGLHLSLAIPGRGPLWALLGLGLICQVGGYFGLTYALGHLPATVTSILFLCVAPLTALFAWMIFGERMSPMEIVGGVLVLAGVWIVGKRERLDIPQMEEVAPPVAPV